MSDAPFRIALVGDFSGRANRKIHPPPTPIEIHPDNFEQVMETLGVALNFTGDVAIQFHELDDFHPDHIYASLALFQPVRELKAELARPRPVSMDPPKPPAGPVAPPPSSGSLLDQIAAAAPAPVAARPKPAPDVRDESAWEQAIRGIAAKHAKPGADPRQEEMLQTVDAVAAAQLRALLHHPDFQALEAAWRSVFFLMQHLETGVDLKIYLIDLSRAEFVENNSALQRVVAASGRDYWSMIAGLYTFQPDSSDCAALARVASVARAAGAPFLAAMDPCLFGCKSMSESADPDDWKHPLAMDDVRAWQELRRSPDASWLGLSMPRFLLRLPYGKKTSPVESFPFEEMPAPPAHDEYLWGNPSVVCACLIAQGGEPGIVNRTDGIPIHVHPSGEVTPQAEMWMTERFAARVVDDGIMPLASVKNSDAVLLVHFHSIAHPAQPLSGAW